MILFLVLALAAAASPGCSRGKRIDRDRAQSEIRSARSFAAESEIFLDFILQGHATRHYAEAHAGYLRDAVEQSAKELDTAAAEPDAADSLRECRIRLREIARELSGIPTATRDRPRLAAARARLGQIRESLTP
ncbi:MAG TPA: hypothetical protein VHA11_13460 [Bryobacteraceae bacterium]|nr:hypothetical protein [Bryobacteraceae bacterium]